MNQLDYQSGLAGGRAGAAAAINEWEAHADSLKRRLQNAESEADAQLTKAHASRFGLAQLVRALSAELQRLDPTNPLLDKERQLAMLEAATVQKAAESGYHYDPATGSIKRIRR